MRSGRYRDAGQAFPIYITVVAGLLFLALAYLAVGQAAVNRGGAQTAADAAALAAAQNTRDQLAGKWLEDLLDPTKWQDIFDGKVAVDDPCWRAGQLATANEATLDACEPLEPLKYTVTVTTNKSVGHSVVPGTENIKSSKSATAVIEPLCTFELPGEGAGNDALPRLTCKDRDWDLNPDDLADLPRPEDLFDVHLAD
ncbi:pilus assembly protein TadG-related protein [Streptomyces diastatochromogenes]|uniref:pilus assembly protein TadG-related protein n=1 Tax=Streptomyces diastatochromogenes TaxID=42236 RepID=UPI003665C3E0